MTNLMYRDGVRWIAINEADGVYDPALLSETAAVRLLASLFSKDTKAVAEDIISMRERELSHGIPILGPVRDGEPQEGFFKRRMVKNGPWLPVRIWWHQAERDEAGHLLEDEGWRCEFAGKAVDPYEQWSRMLPGPFVIDEREYTYLTRLGDWAKEHAPDDPYAKSHKPIDHNKMPTLF